MSVAERASEMTPDSPDELLPTRKTLLDRLRNWEDQESWREFFNLYWKLIYAAAGKAGLTHAEAEDVVQESVLAVAKGIGRFEYKPELCSFKTWLLKVVRSKIANQFARRGRGETAVTNPRRDECATPVIERVPDPVGSVLDAIWDEEWRKNLVDAAIERVKRRMSIEQYQGSCINNFRRRGVEITKNGNVRHTMDRRVVFFDPTD